MKTLEIKFSHDFDVWPGQLPSATLYGVNGQLWKGEQFKKGADNMLRLTALNVDEVNYLKERGMFKSQLA